MARERILVTVKTYPTLSRKYGETVCTAGVREDGTWVRVYPVPFRRLDEKQQYRKFDWIECELVKRNRDPRPESFRPVDVNQIRVVGHMGTKHNWAERRKFLLGKIPVQTRLQVLIDGAKSNKFSLAIFKPTEILAFEWEEDEREWDAAKLDALRNRTKQFELLPEEAWQQVFNVIPKLPYSFSYRFTDADGRESKMEVLDWETGALYWNCLRRCGGNESQALEKVRAKYWDEFRRKDLHFFVGTTLQYHSYAPNPWTIVGVFPIPHEQQMELL
ncbi:MAG: hypothetical protein NZ739_11655 [Verrucomicrobiae bacterium]|nr:hypothetical protein [Verrucomicrobiae bacterium]